MEEHQPAKAGNSCPEGSGGQQTEIRENQEKQAPKSRGQVLIRLFFIDIVSERVHIWRRLCHCDADEKEVCG